MYRRLRMYAATVILVCAVFVMATYQQGEGRQPGGCLPGTKPCHDLCILEGDTCDNDPVCIDVAGNGFNLTSPENGVVFDLGSDGIGEITAWTSLGSDDAWLVLDRNGNGNIDNGLELFGDVTLQPSSFDPNGFRALAVLDEWINGGNANGRMDAGDLIFSDLRLWRDVNHNGISEPGELYSSSELGLVSINLDYREARRRDEHGNWFRYRAQVRDTQGEQMGRWAYDVFLRTLP